MAERFAGRNTIVTGGVSGIGAGIAARLGGEGARVSLWDHDAAALAKADAPHKVTLDVTDAAAVQRAADETARVLGKIDGVSHLGLSRRVLFGAVSAALAVAAAGPAPPPTIGGDEALRRLMGGNARYHANKTQWRDFAAGRAARVTTYRPIASILSCSDARVGPEFVFDQGAGDLFVVRVAGNILEEEGLASLEYAAQFLGAPLIFVMGHSNCGAMDAAIKVVKDNATLPGHLPELIDHLKPALLAAQKTQPADLLAAAIAENVRQTVQNVTAAKPLLADMVSSGKVKVAGGVYDIATGKVTLV